MTTLTVNQIPKLTVEVDNVPKDHHQSQESRELEKLHDLSYLDPKTEIEDSGF